MPVFVTCPACGCRVQMTEGAIGQRVRCIACSERFLADPNVKPPPPPPRRPRQPPPAPDGLPLPPRDQDALAPDGRPFCPGCGRRVNWEWTVCYHCGEQFDYDEDRGRSRFCGPGLHQRRDCLRHRGTTIANMGNITLGVGALSLCVFGVGALVAVPVGIATIVMANSDLNLMKLGQMDPGGRVLTENGRKAAVTGLVLSLLFAAGWLLLLWTHY